MRLFSNRVVRVWAAFVLAVALQTLGPPLPRASAGSIEAPAGGVGQPPAEPESGDTASDRSAIVPESASVALFGLALLGAALAARRLQHRR
jgi:hypothetical protein